MRTFTCLVTDRRYSIPTLTFYLAADENRAREFARWDLALNPQHSAFEVREGDRLLFVEERPQAAG
ncbi:hypothetical protein [Phenylobacterium sp.]|jgi:hypothetical protein|uniref:hypothetical protein n=1 Tax=Phenylobacterium sp. TaxID=1871053 RepID=UPI002F93CD3E